MFFPSKQLFLYIAVRKKISTEVYDRIKYLFPYLCISIIIDSKGSRCLLLGLDWLGCESKLGSPYSESFSMFYNDEHFKSSSNEHRSHFFLQNSNPVFPLAILLCCFYFLLVFWPSYPHRYTYFHLFSRETPQCMKLFFRLLLFVAVFSSCFQYLQVHKRHEETFNCSFLSA